MANTITSTIAKAFIILSLVAEIALMIGGKMIF